MNNSIFSHSIRFVILVLVQVAFITYEIALFDTAFCWIYVLFILMLPLNINHIALLGIAFFTGLVVDVFDDTGGMHAAASVFMAFIRPFVAKLIIPQGGYDNHTVLTLKTNGFQWFFMYCLICIFSHHLLLHIVERADFGQFWWALNTALFSTLFTLTITLLIQYLFFVPRKFR